MITKQQLEDVYREIQELELLWKKGRETKYTISHRLLGLFLINFDDKKELKTK